jgi:glycoprotein endo-alpha-1,2-mannosidase
MLFNISRFRVVRPNRGAFALLTLLGSLFSNGFFAGACQGAEPLVGAYYYPWYGPFNGGHTFEDTLRAHLAPPQGPALDPYNSRSNTTLDNQIDNSHLGNIDFWAVSWWGPQSHENETFKDHILTSPRHSEMDYAIHYEATGRLGTKANPDMTNLLPDFEYLASNYFNNPDYLRIDGRPVVFMYLTRDYFNTQESRDAVADLRATMVSQFGVDPYLIGDDLFTGGVNLQRAQLWDAITDFDVYGTSLETRGSTTNGLDHLKNAFDDAVQALAGTGVGFVPTALPGFNDKGVRDWHDPIPRYMSDDPNSTDGELFERMLKDVALPHLDPNVDNLLMINSFNEWHEDTQIEPTPFHLATNLDDSGTQAFTQGLFYEGYGTRYLDILRAVTVPEPSSVVMAGIASLVLIPAYIRRQKSR